MDGKQRSRGEHGALHSLLAIIGEESPDVAEVAEQLVVGRRLGTDREGGTDLGDDDADLARGHLDPGVLLDRVDRPEFEAQARHEEVGLVAGLAVEGDDVVIAETLASKLLRHQPHLGRSDRVEGNEEAAGQNDSDGGQCDHQCDHVVFS
jgi:hypothetical protein